MHGSAVRRLLKEAQNYQTANPSDCAQGFRRLAPQSDSDLFAWACIIDGPDDTGYQGGAFQVAIAVPDTYPMQPPTCRFVTPICHPNVHPKTGEICLDILKTAWSPAWTLKAVCLAIHLLLSSPEPSSPLNCDAAGLLRTGDTLGYQSLTHMYTQLYALPQ
ncbi:E2 ubiquitin-protein ligase peroxin 4 [Dimargaris verticillata]|uniref:E2 ubiquitin-protein ligase peroxin 4 n=1 Tax=Dimargaris verticillata TaxID=2761393 RepID=A0A9W8EFJ4_9FUNG|nr:E2 ubiquitin-protein ligase peroxin 4 [Dimargaris verticillata]